MALKLFVTKFAVAVADCATEVQCEIPALKLKVLHYAHLIQLLAAHLQLRIKGKTVGVSAHVWSGVTRCCRKLRISYFCKIKMVILKLKINISPAEQNLQLYFCQCYDVLFAGVTMLAKSWIVIMNGIEPVILLEWNIYCHF